MINLLTPKSIILIRRMYWLRVAVVWSAIGIVMLLVAGISLMPSFVLLSTQIAVYQASASEAAEKNTTYQSTSAVLIEASTRARWIIDTAEQVSLSHVRHTLETALPPTVILSGLELSRVESGIGPITLTGVAATRNDVVAAEASIRALPNVAAVALPVTNLTARSDVPFTMTVTWRVLP